ncbi:MAG: hypothetical protein ACFFB3_11970 [Candidatus Hodarchaeota archaeon]
MTQDPNTNEYQDVIIQEPELVMSAFNQDQIALLQSPRYLDLIRIIHEKGPLTLEDIATEYAVLAKDDQAKSESTVYRYLTLLKQSKLVQEAGQRIREGKAHSKTLYSLAARYLIIDQPEIDWKSSYGQGVFKNLVAMLRILYRDKPIDEKALFQWQLKFQQVVDEAKNRLINSKNPDILDILSVWAPYTIMDMMEYIGWVSFLIKEPNAQDSFLKCFESNSELEATPFPTNADKAQGKDHIAFRDVIRRFPEIYCDLMEEDPRRSYLEKSAYFPLFHVLRDRPMSIEEIAEKYNEVALVPRKLQTIYRYIKTLQEAILVIEVGQRVTHGKKTTQKLYGTIARLVSFQGKYEPEWKNERRVWLLEAIIKIIHFLYPHLPKIDKEGFREFRIMGSKYEHEGNYLFNLPENRKIIELFHNCHWKTFYQMYTTFWDYYYFLNIPNLYERLEKCLIK